MNYPFPFWCCQGYIVGCITNAFFASFLPSNTMTSLCSHQFKNLKHCVKPAIIGIFCATHTKKTNAPLPADAILLFTDSAKGGGRETNDKKNKEREQLLGSLLTNTVHDTHEVHGPAWRALRAQWESALLRGHEGASSVSVEAKGGRGFNYDFEASYIDSTTAKIEFKFGGTTVSSLPEFFNPAADKPFHSRLYADFFYDGDYLDTICDLYGIPRTEKPTKAEYLAAVYNNTSKLPFFARLKAAEEAEGGKTKKVRPLYNAKAAISHKSIQAFLMAYKDTTDLAALTAEFQRSQADKQFLLYSGGAFHHDRLLPGELVAESVRGVEGDYLVIQTAVPTTSIRMLLRWKNHQGILFPAWQISLVRGTPAAPTPAPSC